MYKEKVGVLLNLWKIIIMIVLMLCFVYGIFCKIYDNCIKVFFFYYWRVELRYISNVLLIDNRDFGKDCILYIFFIVLVVNIFFNLMCFIFVKVVCKILV